MTGFDSRSSQAEDFKNGTCGLSSLVLSVGGWVGWVQRKGSGAALPLTRHQSSIHCESSRLAQ